MIKIKAMENYDFFQNDHFKKNPYAFFVYLKTCKSRDTIQLLAEVCPIKPGHVRSMEYYNIMSFKTFVCEIVFNAINLFPEIRKYTIIFENELGKSYLIFGLFQELSDDGHPSMGKFFGPDAYINLTLNDIKELYCNNRHDNINSNVIDTLVAFTTMGGSAPRVSTSFEMNEGIIKHKLKFKDLVVPVAF
jgi:hypothetical protein